MTTISGNVQPFHTPKLEAMRQHVEHLFGGYLDGYHEGLIELAWTETKPDASGKYRLTHGRLFGTDQIDELIEEAARLNSQPMCNVYIGAALRKPEAAPFARANDRDALCLTAVYVDLDDPGAATAAKEIYGKIKPTLVVVTGRAPHVRAQMWWKLDEPCADPDQWAALLKGMAAAMRGDSTVYNPSRVMRLAGTIAWPVKDGRTTELTDIGPLREPGQAAYAFGHMASLFPPITTAHTSTHQPTPAANFTTNSLGLADKLQDGREKYMRDTVVANLIEYIGQNGAAPTPQELFDAAWPQYERKVDLTRGGRGPDEFMEKCNYTVQRFEAGSIRGVESLEKAVETYRAKTQARANAPKPPPMMAPLIKTGPFRASSLSGTPPEREWVAEEWIPAGTVTSIYGDGGTGKTLIAQSLLYAAGIGGKWLGLQVPKMNSLGVFCEDDKDELHRRHDSIKQSLGASIGNPFDDVWLWPRVGEDNLLVTFDRDSKPAMSPLFEETMQTVLAERIGLLVLDTAADLFGGNEIIRGQVNYFIKAVCGSYIRRAKEKGWTLTVVILAHPSQAGRNSGSGESGSTGWSNAVRSRLYLTKPDDGLPEQRVLTRKKSNYSAAGDDVKLELIWHKGVIVRQSEAERADDSVAVKSAINQILRKVQSAFDSGHPYGANAGYDNFLSKKIVSDLPHLDRRVVGAALNVIKQKQMLKSDKTSSGDRRGYRLADDVKQGLNP